LVEAGEHRHLAVFPCAQRAVPSSTVIEELVQVHLIEALRHGDTTAAGGWVDDTLIALAVWVPGANSKEWRCPIIAVREGHLRRGYGRAMKLDMMRRATTCGIRFITSTIHRDNDAMIELNRSLDAKFVPDRHRDYLACVVDSSTAWAWFTASSQEAPADSNLRYGISSFGSETPRAPRSFPLRP
jgi:hypothetical protein